MWDCLDDTLDDTQDDTQDEKWQKGFDPPSQTLVNGKVWAEAALMSNRVEVACLGRNQIDSNMNLNSL